MAIYHSLLPLSFLALYSMKSTVVGHDAHTSQKRTVETEEDGHSW